jgi:hypothetical protein
LENPVENNPYQPPTSALSNPASNRDEVILVAVAQRRIIFVFLAYIAISLTLALAKNMIPSLGETLLLVVVSITLIPLAVFQLVNIYRLAEALGLSGALWVIGMFVPYLNFVVFFRIVNKATKYLKEAGVEVGLLGARVQASE